MFLYDLCFNKAKEYLRQSFSKQQFFIHYETIILKRGKQQGHTRLLFLPSTTTYTKAQGILPFPDFWFKKVVMSCMIH